MEDNKLIKERINKLGRLKTNGVNPYPYTYKKSHQAKEILKKYDELKNEEKTEDTVSVAGRIMTMRRMGKATFLDIQDETGRLQAYLRQDDMDEANYKNLKQADIGDIIGVTGKIFRTKTGEITVNAEKWQMLSKTLRPLPDKYHGLKDPELRYRKRYLDLIMNPSEKDKFRMRTKIIALVREFLNKHDFLEVETPVLQVLYGGTNAKPFTTHINAYNMPMYLRVAPELYLKRLVVGGFERVYEIARNFRNEGVDQTHNPEFTMIEWYEAYADYHMMMDRAEAMYKFIANGLFGEESINVHDKKIDISQKWPRMTLVDSLKKYANIDVNDMSDDELEKTMKVNGIEVRGESSRGQILFALFDKLVCDHLQDPIWIIDYPKEVSPLAKAHRDNPDFVERFECYIGGKEIGDGWSEIINPIDQRNRFENEQKSMRAGDDEAHPMDEDFIEAIEYGMPPLGGIGVGIDRLVMLFTNCWSIRDIMFFPIMKPIAKVVEPNETEGTPDLGIDYKTAQELVEKHITEETTKLHLLESEAIMRELAKHFGEDEEKWAIIGLLHDIDWEETKDNTSEHGNRAVEILKEAGATDFLVETIQSHVYGYAENAQLKDKKRSTRIQHCLAAAETLTGLIIAAAIIRPDKSLATMKVKSLKKKFKDKSFAANCNREIIKECEKVGLELAEFLDIGLRSLQRISDKLNL